MKFRHGFFLGLLAIGLTASLQAAAPHPTVLTVQHKSEMLQVVRVIDTDPVVMVDGQEKRIRSEPTYIPQRALDFSPVRIGLKKVSLGGTQITPVYDLADDGPGPARVGNYGGLAEFTATLVAETPVEGAFIAVVLYSDAVFASEAKLFQSQIVVKDLPKLPAGVEVPVSITSKMFTYVPGQRYFVQVFDRNGVEIFTPYAVSGWEYYARVERAQLAEVLKSYVVKQAGKSSPARPVVVIKPLLPEGEKPPAGPITATLTVTPAGWVEDVALSATLPRQVDVAVRSALSGWLFLPRIKAGTALSSHVEVPLHF